MSKVCVVQKRTVIQSYNIICFSQYKSSLNLVIWCHWTRIDLLQLTSYKIVVFHTCLDTFGLPVLFGANYLLHQEQRQIQKQLEGGGTANP